VVKLQSDDVVKKKEVSFRQRRRRDVLQVFCNVLHMLPHVTVYYGELARVRFSVF
jgi:hypothetical protein